VEASFGGGCARRLNPFAGDDHDSGTYLFSGSHLNVFESQAAACFFGIIVRLGTWLSSEDPNLIKANPR
jgi:hypothetical protein